MDFEKIAERERWEDELLQEEQGRRWATGSQDENQSSSAVSKYSKSAYRKEEEEALKRQAEAEALAREKEVAREEREARRRERQRAEADRLKRERDEVEKRSNERRAELHRLAQEAEEEWLKFYRNPNPNPNSTLGTA